MKMSPINPYIQQTEGSDFLAKLWRDVNLSFAERALSKARDLYNEANEFYVECGNIRCLLNGLETIVKSGWLSTFERHAGWAGLNVAEGMKDERRFVQKLVPELDIGSPDDVYAASDNIKGLLNYYSELS